MSIRSKTIISIFLVMSLTLLGLFGVARSVLVEQFNSLEQEQSLENIERVRASFDDIFTQMTSKSADWAGWDDAYQFVQDGNPSFREANLYENAAEQIEMNLIAYFDKNKLPLKGGSHTWIDTLKDRQTIDPISLFPSDSWFFDFESESRSGFLQTAAGPLFVVARPVFNTDLSKPAMGFLIFARFLDETLVANRMELTQFPLQASTVRDGKPEKEEFLAAFQTLRVSSQKSLLTTVDEQHLQGYFLLNDWQNEPIMIVSLSLDRPILAQGMRTIRLLMIAFLIISFLSGILVIILLEKVVIHRLYRLKNNVSAVTQSKPRQHQIPVEGEDEIRRVGDAINLMLDELGQQTRQIEAMLSHMSQGLCQVDERGNLRGEASSYFWELFSSEHSQPFNVLAQIFENSSLSADEVGMIRSLLEVTVGESVVNFELNSDSLPTRFTRNRKGNLQHFECDWSIITSQDRQVAQSILITFRDVTRLRELQAANERERRSMTLLLLILKMGAERYSLFERSARSYLASCQAIVQENRWNETSHKTLKRDLHTIKGNSRVYGLTEIAAHIHGLEELLITAEKAWSHANELRSGLQQLAHLLGELEHAAQILAFKSTQQTAATASLTAPIPLIEATLAFLQSTSTQRKDETQTLSSLILSFRRLLSFPIEHICQDLRSMGEILAQELHLKAPQLLLHSNEPLLLQRDVAGKLRDILVHMVRNSLVHGFQGFNLSSPQIDLQSKISEHWTLIYRDNGKGLNCSALRILGKERGIHDIELWSADKLAELIFEEGISTAQSISDISGRGTGMGAVRAMVEKLGGHLYVELGNQKESSFAPLAFRIVLPLESLILA